MIDFFRDPVWQFVGALLALAAIIISIILFLAQRKRKKLSYEIISKTGILSASEEISGKFQILFQGETVKNVHLLMVRFCNTGNLPITTGDYERLVSLNFKKSERILSAEVSETTPPNLFAKLRTTNQSIELDPILLNPGDSISIKILISEYQNEFEIDGRIVGVRSVEKRVESLGWSMFLMILGLFLISIGMAIMTRNPNINDPVSVVAVISGYLLIISGMLSNRRTRRLTRAIVIRLISGRSSINYKEK